MAKYESPLGTKSIPGQSLREFDVPDESESFAPVRRRAPAMPEQKMNLNNAYQFQEQLQMQDDLEIEKEIRAAREARRTGKERLNDGAKRRIEMLVGMTRSTREVDLEGNKFILQTLRSREMREAILAASEFDQTVQAPFEMRRQLLSRSLNQVAGVDVAQFVGSDSLDARLALIDDLDEALLNRLYDEYLLLARESREKFSVKTKDEVKELADDLKK